MLQEEAGILFMRRVEVHAHPQAARGIGVVGAVPVKRHGAAETGEGTVMKRRRVEASVA
ncbi:MAG: hypothetical protein NVSMB65_12660 [Chloroflexota bacterium]